MNDLSGNRSVNGNAINNGVKLAVEEINAAGGVLGRQIKLVTYDNKNDSQESINGYTRLADLDKASAVITSDASSICLSLVEISNQKKIPLMGMPSDPRAVMNPDTQEVYPYMFLVDQPNAPQQANIMAKYIEANTDLRKAAVFYDQSNAYTVTNSQAFIEIWKEIGEVVIVETCNSNDQDYKTQLNKIKNSGAEFIYCPNMPSQLVMMVQQAGSVRSGYPVYGRDGYGGSVPESLERSSELIAGLLPGWSAGCRTRRFSRSLSPTKQNTAKIPSSNLSTDMMQCTF